MSEPGRCRRRAQPASTSTPGYRRESSSAAARCVVARRPLNSPAPARVNAPTQIDAILMPPSAASRKAPRTPSGIGAVGSAGSGRIMVSASASVQGPRRPHGKDPRVHPIGRDADAHPVRPPPVGQPGASEGLDRGRKIKGQNPVEREYGHHVHGNTVLYDAFLARPLSSLPGSFHAFVHGCRGVPKPLTKSRWFWQSCHFHRLLRSLIMKALV